MPPSHKPVGYTSVSPYLIVDGASETIDFLTRVFDAKELRRFPDSSGRLRWAPGSANSSPQSAQTDSDGGISRWHREHCLIAPLLVRPAARESGERVRGKSRATRKAMSVQEVMGVGRTNPGGTATELAAA